MPEKRKGFVTFRSVLIGLIGVVLINLITPFNNYVVNQSGIVGNSLSIGTVIFAVLVIGVLNAPLLKFAPRWALARNELAVALGMVLVGGAIPSVGLFRYLPGHLVGPFYVASQNAQHADLMRNMALPDWLFPTFDSKDPAARGNEAVVQNFYGRAPVSGDDTFFNRVRAVPYGAWLRPLAAWGIFIGLMLTALMCITVIFRRQWVENERLPFPIATVYGALIEPPKTGRAFNRLFRARSFWTAAAMVFSVQILAGLHMYWPNAPEIPLKYDLKPMFADSAFWSQGEWYFFQQKIFFTVIGICYFVQTRVLLSLVTFCMLANLTKMTLASAGSDYTVPMQEDQTFGSATVMLAIILWVARKHLLAVLRQMVGQGRGNDPRGFYLPYAFAGWGVVLAAGGMVVWLVAASVSPISAAVIVTMLLALLLLVGRVVAETGILYVLVAVPLTQPMIYGVQGLESTQIRATLNSFFFGRVFFNMFVHDTRESLPNYSTTALRLTDQSVVERESSKRSAWTYVGVLMLALLVAYVTAASSTLYCFYNNAATLGQPPAAPLSEWPTVIMPRAALEQTTNYVPPGKGTTVNHSHALLYGIGAVVTLALSFLNLRFASWPLPPVGFLLSTSWGVQCTWFSLLLGWIAKTILVRFGGSKLFFAAQPAFIGLVVGEIAAMGLWIIVALVLASMGVEYKVVQILPM